MHLHVLMHSGCQASKRGATNEAGAAPGKTSTCTTHAQQHAQLPTPQSGGAHRQRGTLQSPISHPGGTATPSLLWVPGNSLHHPTTEELQKPPPPRFELGSVTVRCLCSLCPLLASINQHKLPVYYTFEMVACNPHTP